MKYSVQAYDVEVPVSAGAIGDAELATTESDFHRIYAELHGEGSGYKEGGSKITAFIVRGHGLTEEPNLAKEAVPAAPTRTTRPVHWPEFGEFRPTDVVQMHGTALDERLEGPMLIELPDTVVVLRPGQHARFDDFGSLLVDLD
jgi:N-methylhydantoinase A